MTTPPIAHPPVTETIRREGITVLTKSDSTVLDLVFVHGLNGHPQKSWTDPNTGFFWPRDLARALPRARCMMFGYYANFQDGKRNPMGVQQHAESLLVNLRNNRARSVSEKPLVFICHSLGGLIVKEALILSLSRAHWNSIVRSTKLIFFFGTPHGGSHLLGKANVSLLEKLAKVAFLEIPKQLRSVLQPRAQELFSINDEFPRVRENMTTVNFYEQKPIAGLKELVVGKDSATTAYGDEENIPIYRDHRDLIRYPHENDDVYVQISQTIHFKLDLMPGIGKNASLKDDSENLEAYVQSLMVGSQMSFVAIKEPSPNTLGWLWEDQTGIVRWISQDRGLHWITGMPGSGKSVLMHELASWSHRNYSKTHIVVSHYFSSHASSYESSARGFLGRVLAAILSTQPACLKVLHDKYDDVVSKIHYGPGDSQWSLYELKGALKQVMTEGPRGLNVLLIVDALDECSDFPVRDAVTYLESLVAPSRHVSCKVCFSTRRIPGDPVSILGRYPGFVLEDKNAADIASFVTQMIKAVDADDLQSGLSTITQDLIRRAEGNFLWVDLILNEIVTAFQQGNTIGELKKIVVETPRELNDLYDRLVGKVDSTNVQEASAMLSVVLCAASPLTLTQFRYVMAFGTGNKSLQATSSQSSDDGMMRRRIRSRCGGLLELINTGGDSSTGTTFSESAETYVQFTHHSIKDFLLRKGGTYTVTETKDDPPSIVGSRILGQACLNYLQSDEVKTVAQELDDDPNGWNSGTQKNYPFLHYAMTNWTRHTGELEKGGVNLVEKVHHFLLSEHGHFANWCTLQSLIDPAHVEGFSDKPLYLAFEKGYCELIRREIEHDVINSQEIEDYQLYMEVAAYRGHKSAVELLMEIQTYGRSRILGSALLEAASAGHLEIVKLLMDGGANLKVIGGRCGNVLNAALHSGNWDVTKYIIDEGYGILANSWYYDLSLIYVMDGHSYRSDDPDNILHAIQDRAFADCLKVFSEFSHVTTLSLELLSLKTSLFSILESGNLEIVKLIISKDTEIRSTMPGGFTLLLLAALAGTVEAVKAIMVNGADPDVESDDGENIFHAAAINKSEEVLNHLLSLHRPSNKPDYLGRTPLHIAALCGSRSKVQSILSAGAKPTKVDDDQYNIYHHGIQGSYENIDLPTLRSPLSDSVHINSKTYEGMTPLHLAAESGLLADVIWVLNSGGDIRSLNYQNKSVLHSAARNIFYDCEDILNLLLDKGLSIRATDDAAMTVLHHALWRPQSDVVGRRKRDMAQWSKNTKKSRPDALDGKLRLLIRRGAEINAQDSDGNTPLHLAAHRGQKEPIVTLLELGADRGIEDQNGLLPVDYARDEDLRELLEPGSK